jgi:hypothetical protein
MQPGTGLRAMSGLPARSCERAKGSGLAPR